MREYSVPANYVPRPEDTLTDDVFGHAEKWPTHPGFARRVGQAWVDVTYRQLADEVTRLAAGLMSFGVQTGDRVALLSATRYEWMVADYAIWAAGAAVVPIYATSSAEQIDWILRDSGAVAIIVETGDHAATVASVRPNAPDLRHVWTIEADQLDDVVAAGRSTPDADVEARRTAVTSDMLATIIYTSGTTGRPKGCAMTHANLLFGTRNVCTAPNIREQVFNERTRTLHFLPLAHVLAREIQLAAVHNRVYLAHGDIANLPPQLVDFKPTAVLAMPRIFERIYNTAKHKAVAGGKEKIFHQAETTAMAYSQALDAGGPGLTLRLRHAVLDKLVYGKVRAAVGGNVQYAVSGGAALGERLGHFFRGVGINVLEGYGLTETFAAATVNVPGGQRMGSVGRPIPGTSIKIADDGEVLIKGGQVFGGYWHNDAATAEAFDADGWFRTGDLGSLDDDGFLRITGRKKEILVTSSGKNVAPAVLEDRLRAHWLVSQCIVVGDARPFIGALITVDAEVFPQWKTEHGKDPAATIEDLRSDPDLVAALQEAVDDANKAVSSAEAIKKFRVLVTDFGIETGELTPTLKIKRDVVLKRFAPELESVYEK